MIEINKKLVMVNVINTNPDMMDLCVEGLKKAIKPNGWEFKAETDTVAMDTLNFYGKLKTSDAYYHIFIESDCLIVDELFFLKMLSCFEDETVGLVSVFGIGIGANASTVGCYAMQEENGEVSIVGKTNHAGEIAIPTPMVWCIKGDVVPPEVDAEALPGAVAMEYRLKGLRCVVPHQDTPLCLFVKEEESRRKKGTQLLETIYGMAMRFLGVQYMQVGRSVDFIDRANFIKNEECEFSLLRIDDGSYIGDAVNFDLHYPISIGKAVHIGRDVTIGKVTGAENGKNETIISDRVVIENDVVIICGITIGRGTKVMAGSVVVSDMPPYVVVAGDPAVIIAVYDYDSCKYWPVNNGVEAEDLLSRRGISGPLVTIGVPTYNRSRFLRKCLEAIFYDIGDDEQFEILVSDNCSEDDTQELVEEFASRYSNLTYIRNKKNIGASANFERIYNIAKGKFVFTLGDDDYYRIGVLYRILEAVKQNHDCSIIAMRPIEKNGAIVRGKGPISYLEYYSYLCTWISLHGFRTDIARQVKIDEKYKDGYFLQVVKQFAMLTMEPKYAILEIDPFRYDIGAALDILEEEHEKLDREGKLTDFSYVFFHEYYTTLEECKCFGLTDDAIRHEKKRHLFELVIDWIERIGNRCIAWSRRDTMKYYDEQYCNEPYYLEWREKLQKIIDGDRLVENT